jgi:hypothetical protein
MQLEIHGTQVVSTLTWRKKDSKGTAARLRAADGILQSNAIAFAFYLLYLFFFYLFKIASENNTIVKKKKNQMKTADVLLGAKWQCIWISINSIRWNGRIIRR